MSFHSYFLVLWTLLVCTGELCKRWHNPFESGGMFLIVDVSLKWWGRIGINLELLSPLCGFLRKSVELCTLVRPSEFLSLMCVRGCTLRFWAHQPWCRLAWCLSDCCHTNIRPEVSVDAFESNDNVLQSSWHHCSQRNYECGGHINFSFWSN